MMQKEMDSLCQGLYEVWKFYNLLMYLLCIKKILNEYRLFRKQFDLNHDTWSLPSTTYLRRRFIFSRYSKSISEKYYLFKGVYKL